MNRIALIFVIMIVVVAISFIAMLLSLSRPKRIGIVPGGLTLAKVSLPGGGKGVYLNSYPMNHLGQIQGVSLRFDSTTNRFYIDKYVVYWHPFVTFEAQSDWPVLIDVTSYAQGEYEIWYWTSAHRYELAEKFQIP